MRRWAPQSILPRGCTQTDGSVRNVQGPLALDGQYNLPYGQAMDTLSYPVHGSKSINRARKALPGIAWTWVPSQANRWVGMQRELISQPSSSTERRGAEAHSTARHFRLPAHRYLSNRSLQMTNAEL